MDSIGRTTQTLGPPHEIDGVMIRTAQWTVYRDARHETLTGQGYVSGSAPYYQATLVNPISLRRTDAQGRTLDQVMAVRESAAGRLCASNEFSQSAWVSWSHSIYDDAGRLVASRAYHTIPVEGDGLPGANFDQTTYGYDAAGRQNQVRTPGGTITRTTFDARGRITGTWIGTDDVGATDARPQGVAAFSPEMIAGLQFWGSGAHGLFQTAAGTTPVTTAGDPVGRWNDRRGGSSRNFHQSSSGNRPSLSPQWINGRPAVRFSQTGGAKYLRLDDSLFTADASTPATIFALLRTTTSSPGNERLIAKSSNSGDYSLALQRSEGSDKLLATMANQTNVVAQYAHDDAVSVAGDVRCVASIWNDRTLYFYRDGLLIDQQAVDNSSILTAPATEQGWLIGGELRDGSPTWLCDADVAEFLIFDRALSKDELRRLFAWAAGEPVPAVGNNMVQVSSRSYSGSCDCSQPAAETLYIDDDPANNRVTLYAYDYRNRLTAVDGEENFFEQRTYDNLDRVVQVDRRVGSSGGGLISRSKTYYDARGQVYKTEIFGADATSGDLTPPIVGLNWYDAAGNLAAAVAPGAKDLRVFTKSEFDGDGRQTATYYTVYTGSQPPTYSGATTVTNSDRVFDQTENTFDPAGNLTLNTSYRRYPGSSAVNKLTTSDARRFRIANWYDGIGRLTAAATYGTASTTRPASPPPSADAAPVSLTRYDSAGRQFEGVDPLLRVTRREYDALGRTTSTIGNFTGCGCPGNETDVTVRQAYDGDGRLVRLTAENPATGLQITTYLYGVVSPGSALSSNDLLASVIYPDAVDAADRVSYAYNRQGEQIRIADQNATVRDVEFDKLGRLIVDRVTIVGSGVDGAVRRVETVYDSRGRVETRSNISATTGGTIVNQLKYDYDAFGRVTREYQSHAGAGNTG
ncbi:MAG: hypothetical protein J0M17_27115, partial [Planctomycetes bacterium]|nr:hypothetical protein [Planctomycetota bacterium]